MQERANTLGPGGFIVFGAFDAFVMQILVEPPAFADENVAETFDVVHNARAFARANVEPDARKGFHSCRGSKPQDHALVPPDRR